MHHQNGSESGEELLPGCVLRFHRNPQLTETISGERQGTNQMKTPLAPSVVRFSKYYLTDFRVLSRNAGSITKSVAVNKMKKRITPTFILISVSALLLAAAQDIQGHRLVGLLIDVDAELTRVLDGLAVQVEDHVLQFDACRGGCVAIAWRCFHSPR